MQKLAKIYTINSGFYDVYYKDKLIRLRGAGKLRNNEQTPLVGDIVEFSEGFVENILERKNELIRPRVANIDQAFVIYSYNEPKFSSLIVDKYLAMIEFSEIKPVIIFTKLDLKSQDDWYEKYNSMGYECYEIEQKVNKNHSFLLSLIQNKTSVFMGQSGVGKTTLINDLTNQELKTQQISKSLNRGKHTTRIVQIHRYENGEVIDTPGFSNLTLTLTQLEVARSFHSFQINAIQCKFRSCLHDKVEINNCKIKQLVEEKKIPMFRYENYLKLLKEAKENDEKKIY